MTLYLYKNGTNVPVLTIENVQSYTDNKVLTEDGTVYEPLADWVELSSLPDCSEALREAWRAGHLTDKVRIDELEALVALLFYGGEGE